MSELTPLPTGGTAIIAGEWERNPIVELTPLPTGGTAVIVEWRRRNLTSRSRRLIAAKRRTITLR